MINASGGQHAIYVEVNTIVSRAAHVRQKHPFVEQRRYRGAERGVDDSEFCVAHLVRVVELLQL
jgi:hypothetical protein